MRSRLRWCWVLVAMSAAAAERKFDFSELSEGQTPSGFRSSVAGAGQPGTWKIVLDDVPSPMQLLTPQARSVSKKSVLAQVAQDPADEHFPLFIFDGETFGDFTLTTRFKTVGGRNEQMAGIAFHLQNEKNYYVVRASSLGNNLRFYKVVNGERGPLVGPEVPVPTNTWQELTIECKGNQIRALLEGKELVNVNDKATPFTSGRIAFWTKSDSVSYFSDTRITYTPREMPAQTLVNDALEKYPRLLDLKIYVPGRDSGPPRLVGTKLNTETNRPAGDPEKATMTEGTIFYGKDQGYVSVTMPIKDRNAEPIAAIRVKMKSFAGQTEQNILVRATPVVRYIQEKVLSLQDLVE
jgi:hypothetical protein